MILNGVEYRISHFEQSLWQLPVPHLTVQVTVPVGKRLDNGSAFQCEIKNQRMVCILTSNTPVRRGTYDTSSGNNNNNNNIMMMRATSFVFVVGIPYLTVASHHGIGSEADARP